MENATETTSSEVQTGSFAELTGLLDGTVTPQPQVSETTTTETPAETTTETPATTIEVTPAETGNISLEDAPEVTATPTAGEDEFEAKYRERISKDFGVDMDGLKTKLNTPAQSTYKTELAKLADEFEVGTKMSKADFFTYVATDFKDLPAVDALDFKLKLESPTLTPEERAYILTEKYKLYEDATPQEKAIGKYQMEKDHAAAIGEFEAKKANLREALVAPEAPKVNVEYEQKQAYWKSEAANVVKMFDKLPITIKVTDPLDKTKTTEVPINFDIPAKDKQLIESWIVNNGANTSAKSAQDMLPLVQKIFMAEHAPKLIQKSVERALSHNNEQWTLKMANYQQPKGGSPSLTPTAKKGSATEFFQAMDN